MTNPEVSVRIEHPPRKLQLWQAIAISVGFMAPTLAMSLNGIGIAGLAGSSVPLVFLVAFAGVGAVSYGFVRLTSHFNHAGSIYGLVGITVGPRAGFFGGWALLGTYLFFAACTIGAGGVFYDAFVAQTGLEVLRLPWLVTAMIVAGVVLLLNIRESNVSANVLLAIGGLGILAMLVLAAVVFGRIGTGTAPRQQTLDLASAFTMGDTPFGVIMAASVFAFLSWAGFESCSSLGEETANPQRNIPRAIAGSVVLGGILYVIMMTAQTLGFGTDAVGVETFANSESSITDLAALYIGPWFSVLLAATALFVSLASTIGSTAAAARLLFALSRDGFGPKTFGRLSQRGVPAAAVIAIVTVAFLMCLGLGVLGTAAFDVYYWYATIAVLCMLVAYAVASIGVIWFTVKSRTIPRWEIAIPVAGIAYLAFVYTQQAFGQEPPYTLFPWIAAAWCLIGVAVIVFAPSLTQRIGARLTEESDV